MVDEVDDIIEPGAYKATLATRLPKVCWHHAWDQPIGRVLAIEELMPGDPRLPAKTRDGKPWPREGGALTATMQFNMKSDRGREAFAAIRFYSESGECEWSIGYQVPKGTAAKDKNGIRHLKAINLYELSFVLFGAHTMTGTLALKAAVAVMHDAQTSGRVTITLDEIKATMDRLGLDGKAAAKPDDDEAPPAPDQAPIPAPVDEAVDAEGEPDGQALLFDDDTDAELAALLTAVDDADLDADAELPPDATLPPDDEDEEPVAVGTKALVAALVSSGADPWYTDLADVEGKRKLTVEQRRRKPTLPGSDTAWPIGDRTDLQAAISSYGRAKPSERDKVKRWIIKRARELGAVNLLPDSWNVSKALPSDADTDVESVCGDAVLFDTMNGWMRKDGSYSHDDGSTHSDHMDPPEGFVADPQGYYTRHVAAHDGKAEGGADRDRGNAEALRRYWTVGAGSAKIRWNTPGDFSRCVRELREHMGERAKGYCFTGDTEVITREGVAPLAELVDTDPILLTQDVPTSPHAGPVRRDGRWVQAPVRSYGEQRVLRVTLRRGRDRKTVGATREHIWFAAPDARTNARRSVREVTTADLRPGMALAALMPKPVSPRSLPSPFGVAAGIVFGDGHVQPNKGAMVDLWGEKDAHLLRYFEQALQRPCKTASGLLGVRVTGLPASWKAGPSLDEGTPYLYGWLAGYIAADGTVGTGGNVTLSSANPDHLRHAAAVAHRIGVACHPIHSHMRIGLGSEPTPLYRMNLVGTSVSADLLVLPEHRRRFEAAPRRVDSVRWVVESVEDRGEAEEVFCAEVPGTETFALADYVWVHNCANRHHEVTGMWPGDRDNKAAQTKDGTAAADTPGDPVDPVPPDPSAPEHTGVMVAVYPDPEAAEQIAVPGGLKPDELHVTLAYLGDVGDATRDGLTLGSSVDKISAAARLAAAAHEPLSGSVGGIGKFPEGEDGTPVWAPVDVPGLSAVREAVVEALEASGLPVMNDHGFTPHMTLGYNLDLSLLPPIADVSVGFSHVAVVAGDARVNVPLGTDHVAASADEQAAPPLPAPAPAPAPEPSQKAVAYDPAIETGPDAGHRSPLRRETKGYPQLEGTFEERQERIHAALCDALLPDYDDDDEKATQQHHVQVNGTWDDRVVATVHDWSGPGESQESYEVGYRVDDDGTVHLGEPHQVRLSIVLADTDTGADTDYDDGGGDEVPVGDLLPLAEMVEAVTHGFKTLPPDEVKAGRVLSAANMQRLTAAVEHLISVLSAAGVHIRGEDEPPPNPATVDADTTAPAARDEAKQIDAAAVDALLADITKVTG